MSALQTQVLTECLHEAGLPEGVFNIVNGLGTVVGAEITRNPGVAKISFRSEERRVGRYRVDLGGSVIF
jgi:aldehyde dehydrogenase (NAD+)